VTRERPAGGSGHRLEEQSAGVEGRAVGVDELGQHADLAVFADDLLPKGEVMFGEDGLMASSRTSSETYLAVKLAFTVLFALTLWSSARL